MVRKDSKSMLEIGVLVGGMEVVAKQQCIGPLPENMGVFIGDRKKL